VDGFDPVTVDRRPFSPTQMPEWHAARPDRRVGQPEQLDRPPDGRA